MAGQLLPDRRALADAAALKTRAPCATATTACQRRQAVHLRRWRQRFAVVLVRTGEDGPKAFRRWSCLKDAPGLLRRQRAQDGLAHAVDPAGDFTDCRVPAEKPAFRRRRRFRHRHGRARRRPPEHRRLLAGRRPVGARKGAGLCRRSARRSARRSTSSRRCNQLADMETELQAARVALHRCLELDRKAHDAGKWSAMAKACDRYGLQRRQRRAAAVRRLRLSA